MKRSQGCSSGVAGRWVRSGRQARCLPGIVPGAREGHLSLQMPADEDAVAFSEKPGFQSTDTFTGIQFLAIIKEPHLLFLSYFSCLSRQGAPLVGVEQSWGIMYFQV